MNVKWVDRWRDRGYLNGTQATLRSIHDVMPSNEAPIPVIDGANNIDTDDE